VAAILRLSTSRFYVQAYITQKQVQRTVHFSDGGQKNAQCIAPYAPCMSTPLVCNVTKVYQKLCWQLDRQSFYWSIFAM